MLVRRSAAEEVGYLDPDFFVYSDETDFWKRLGDAGWRMLYVPAAEAVHHEQLATDPSAGERRVVEFHRNRDLYMRKHHGPLAARGARAHGLVVPVAGAGGARPARARPGWYLLHARKALRPGKGEGMREAAEEYNAGRASSAE